MIDLSSIKIPINQLYHPTNIFDPESENIVYSRGNLNTAKFVPILLKEWFYLIKKGGFLIIDYQPNSLCDLKKLEEYFRWLWKDKYEITFHGNINGSEIKNLNEEKLKLFINGGRKYIKGKWIRFICQKTEILKILGDDITKWTFGIISNGKRETWIGQIIHSIRVQKIPNYEIIICGTYSKRIEKDMHYIPFNKRDDRGWITKKKNLIVKKAKFENICMLHDRMILNKDWYRGMKKWGNCFENLGCRQLFEGIRINDWMVSHYLIDIEDGEKFSFESYADYRDWYPTIWFLGQMNIFKKSIITKNKLWWNEALYYGGREDYHFSKGLNNHGFIHRFNSFSKVSTLTNKYVNPTWIKYDSNSIDPHMQLNNLNSFLKFFTYLILKTLNFLGINLSFKMLENLRGRIYTFILMFNPKKYSHNKEWRKTIQQ